MSCEDAHIRHFSSSTSMGVVAKKLNLKEIERDKTFILSAALQIV